MSDSDLEQPSSNEKDFWMKQLSVEIEKLRTNLDFVTSLKITALMFLTLLITLILYHGLRLRRFPLTLYHIYYHGPNAAAVAAANDGGVILEPRRDSRWRDDLNDKCRKLEDKIAKLEASFQPLNDRLQFILHRIEARERKIGALGGRLESKQYK